MANSLALNFTVICMVKDPVGYEETFVEELEALNELNITNPEPLYSLNEKSWLFSAIAIGNILGIIPLTQLINRFGVRKTFMLYGLTSGIGTLILPFCVSLGFVPVFMVRCMQGFGLAISMASLGAIVSAWSSLHTAGMYISILSMHIQFGAIIVMPMSGALCETELGWPAIYYILGILTIFSFALFYGFYTDMPLEHRFVGQKEISIISDGKISKNGEKIPIPYLKIVIDLPVIGIIVSCLGGSFALQIILQYGPTYLNKVLGFDLTKTGFAAALPYVFAGIVKLIAGPFSDMLTCISERGRIIFFNTLSQLPIVVCFIMMASLPSELGWLIQISYSMVNSFSGLNAVGVAKCVQLLAQHHAHFIMIIMSLVNSIVILVLPIIVSFVAPDNTPSQWATLFYILAVIVFVTMMFFNFVCQVEPREWARTDSDHGSIIPDSMHPTQVTVQREPSNTVCKVISGHMHNLKIHPLDESEITAQKKTNKRFSIKKTSMMTTLPSLNENRLGEVHQWVASIPLSKPVRNIPRDFSDGEIIAHYLPRYIALNNFTHVNSIALRRYNWETLQKMVFNYLNIYLNVEQIRDLVDGKPGVMESFLYILKDKIDVAIVERRFRPSKRRSSSTTRGSTLSLNQSDSEYENGAQSTTKIASTPKSQIHKNEQGTAQEIQKMQAQIQYLERIIDQKDEHIAALTKKLELINSQNGNRNKQEKSAREQEEHNQILLNQIRYLENVVQQKEEHNLTLSKQVEKLMEIVYGDTINCGRASANSPMDSSELTSPIISMAAQSYGSELFNEFLMATENMTQTERQRVFPDYFEKCNVLGWEFAQNVTEMIRLYGKYDDAVTLARIGLPPFVAKFLTLNETIMESGLEQLCAKSEVQFQCQFGFGESRAQILQRIQNLKKFDGNMYLLLEKDCKKETRKQVNYPCLGHNVSSWASSCTTKIDEYNSTRTTLNEQIYNIHINAAAHATRAAKNANPEDSKNFIPTKIIIENILRKALKQITEIESQKCRSLDAMLKCLLPTAKANCGSVAADALKTAISVGYLRRERSLALTLSFDQLDMDPDPLCQAIENNS
uniref:Major facilitator superfamily (MFS) profile domain-containing protein n=1 Tax=Panagrolaimus sp. JU765 TaxID=591449 RepID=A0AC34QKB2_9BILA